jgi:hypothetical protein
MRWTRGVGLKFAHAGCHPITPQTTKTVDIDFPRRVFPTTHRSSYQRPIMYYQCLNRLDVLV